MVQLLGARGKPLRAQAGVVSRRREIKARDLMTSPVITISINATVGEAVDLLNEKRVSCLPVVDEQGRLVRLLTHSDFDLHPRFMLMGGHLYTLLDELATVGDVESLAHTLRSKPIRDLPKRTLVTVEEDDPIEKAIELMLEKKVHRIPVMRAGHLVGVITRHDLLKLFTEKGMPG